MMERKLFKTRLCILYQRGRCNRQSCSFAHGEAELRRFGTSVPGRRDYRAGDLRGTLGKRYSPRRRYSPERDGRSRHAFHGYSPSRSPEDNSFIDRKRRKKHHMDGQSDVSENLKMSDGTEDHARARKSASSHSRYAPKEQLKQVQSDITHLDHHKSQLGSYLEERVQEADTLASKIKELEGQLYKEKKECKRINSRIKKFVKAHHRYSRLQDEVKRSQIQLQNIGEQLGLDAIGISNKEEDSSINIVSDGEAPDDHNSPRDEQQQIHDSLNGKVPQFDQAGPEEPPPGKVKLSRWGAYPPQLTHDKEVDALDGRMSSLTYSGEGIKQKRDKNVSSAKSRGGSGLAAHSVDVFVDIEDENAEVAADVASMRNNEAVALQNKVLTFVIPPPPPVRKNTYAKYAGDDENVDVDSLGEKGKTGAVDIAS